MQGVKERLESRQNLHTTLSIGIAIYPDDADTTESLFMQADKALFHSKAQGRNNFQVFSEMQESGRGFVDTNLTAQFYNCIKKSVATGAFSAHRGCDHASNSLSGSIGALA